MKAWYFVLLIVLTACNSRKPIAGSNPRVQIETSYGDIQVELFPDKAPVTVAAFLKNVEAGVYTGASFYRVLKNPDLAPQYNNGLIQGGVHAVPGSRNLPLIPHESPRATGLTHTDGTISMARTAPGTASSEFFICIGDQVQFDSSRRTNPDGQGYAAFGKVIEGMKAVRRIQLQPSNGEDLVEPVKIKSIKKL